MLWKQALERHSHTSALTQSYLEKSKSMRSRYAEEYSGEAAIVSGRVKGTGMRKQRCERHRVCERGKTTDIKDLRRDEERDRKEGDGEANQDGRGKDGASFLRQ